jgi:hypothetical protein
VGTGDSPGTAFMNSSRLSNARSAMLSHSELAVNSKSDSIKKPAIESCFAQAVYILDQRIIAHKNIP